MALQLLLYGREQLYAAPAARDEGSQPAQPAILLVQQRVQPAAWLDQVLRECQNVVHTAAEGCLSFS